MSGIKLISRHDLFRVRYNPLNVPGPIANRVLSKKKHPLYAKVAHTYEHYDKNTLWWATSSYGLLSEKVVVRNWCYRRVKIAFRESLRKNGFDEKGRKIVPDPTGKGKPTTTVGQTGTLIFDVYPEVKRASLETIQKKTDEALDILLRNSTKPLPTKPYKGPRKLWK